MYQDQFRMHHGQRPRLICGVCKPAGRKFPQRSLLESAYQSRNPVGRGKRKVPLGKIDPSVITGPWINLAQPQAVHMADVLGREAMIPVSLVNQPLRRSK